MLLVSRGLGLLILRACLSTVPNVAFVCGTQNGDGGGEAAGGVAVHLHVRLFAAARAGQGNVPALPRRQETDRERSRRRRHR